MKKVRGNKRVPVIVEKFFSGEDFRVYVLEDKVIGAFHRRAASIVGDGKSNIKTLLSQKIKKDKEAPFYPRVKSRLTRQ